MTTACRKLFSLIDLSPPSKRDAYLHIGRETFSFRLLLPFYEMSSHLLCSFLETFDMRKRPRLLLFRLYWHRTRHLNCQAQRNRCTFDRAALTRAHQTPRLSEGMPRFEVYWQTEDKILVYLTCFQSERAELVNPRHCRQTDTFLIYLLLLRKADPYFSGLIGCGSV